MNNQPNTTLVKLGVGFYINPAHITSAHISQNGTVKINLVDTEFQIGPNDPANIVARELIDSLAEPSLEEREFAILAATADVVTGLNKILDVKQL